MGFCGLTVLFILFCRIQPLLAQAIRLYLEQRLEYPVYGHLFDRFLGATSGSDGVVDHSHLGNMLDSLSLTAALLGQERTEAITELLKVCALLPVV